MCKQSRVHAATCTVYHFSALPGETLQAFWFSLPAAIAKLTPWGVGREGSVGDGRKEEGEGVGIGERGGERVSEGERKGGGEGKK